MADQSEIVAYANDHVPELVLMAAGLMMLVIVWAYLRNRDGVGYKAAVAVGVAAGIAMAVMLVDRGDRWYSFGKAVIAIAAFALIIRPFKDTNFALIIAALAMVLVYSWLGGLSGDLSVLAEGWPRVGVAVLAGALVYSVLHFVQALAQTVGKVLNWWPALFVLGTVCLLEGALAISGGGSLLDIYRDFSSGDGAESAIRLFARRRPCMCQTTGMQVDVRADGPGIRTGRIRFRYGRCLICRTVFSEFIIDS